MFARACVCVRAQIVIELGRRTNEPPFQPSTNTKDVLNPSARQFALTIYLREALIG